MEDARSRTTLCRAWRCCDQSSSRAGKTQAVTLISQPFFFQHRPHGNKQARSKRRQNQLVAQEVKLQAVAPRWVAKMALDFGWRVACSTPPPMRRNGGLWPGGTAISWRPGVGKALTHRADSHRRLTAHTKFGTCTSWISVPGPQVWKEDALGWAEKVDIGGERWLLGGDLN